LENSVVLDDLGVQFFREHDRLHQIGHAQAGASCFITIGRANPAFGGSNSGMASTQFPLLIEQAVVRQNQVSAVADQQIPANCNPQFAQAIDFAKQCNRVDNNAVSNHANLAASQNSRGDQVKNVFNATMEDSVSGIIAALAANNNVNLCGKHVDDLALTFVAPLRSN